MTDKKLRILVFQKTIYKNYAVLIVSLYFISTYILPSIFLSYFGWQNPRYFQAEVELLEWLPPLFSFIVPILAFYFVPFSKKSYRIKEADYPRVLIVSVILVVINIVFITLNLSGLSGFRYGNQPISESYTGFISLYLIGKVCLNFFMISYIFLPELFFKKHRKNIPQATLIISALFIGNTGLASTLFAIIFSIFIIISIYAEDLLFKNLILLLKRHLKALSRLRIRKGLIAYVFITPIVLLLLYFGWLYGNSVKMNVPISEVMNWSQSRFSNLLEFIQYLVFRHSTDYYSLRFALENYAYQLDFNVISEHFLEPLRTAVFRFDVLTGGFFDITRPAYGSLSRINVTMVATSFRIREGTSPGPIAGFLYCFPFPLNFLAFSSYLFLLLKFFEMIFKTIGRKINFIGLLLFTYFMRGFFMSPIDILTIFNIYAIHLSIFVLIYFLYVRHSHKRKLI